MSDEPDPLMEDLADAESLAAENARLRAALEEAQETLRAIQAGEVDAIVVAGQQGEQVYSLSGAESVYRLIVQTMQEATLTLTPEGTILSCNPQAEALIRTPPGALLGRPLADFLMPEGHPALADFLARSQAEPVRQRLVLQAADGSPVPAHVAAHPIPQPQGPCICLVATDLTALETSLATLRQIREQQEALQASEQRYRGVVENTTAIVLRVSPSGRITFANERALAFFGYSRQELLGRPAVGTIVPVRETTGRDLAAMVETILANPDRVHANEIENTRKDGERVWVEWTNSGVYDANGHLVELLAVGIDATERRRAEETLRQLNSTLEQRVQERTAALAQQADQLRALAGELTLAEQRERRRLAQVLHDDHQQLLVAAKLRIVHVARGQSPEVRAACQEAGGLLDEAMLHARSLTRDLSPPVLYTGGLVPALTWLAGWMGERHRLRVEVHADPAAIPSSEAITVLLYQSVRELLFNVVKHAGTDAARLAVARTDGQVRITVSDEGIGFEPAQVRPEGGAQGGFGLFSIQQRLALFDGRLEISSAPDRGSQFTLWAPIRPEASESERRPAPAAARPPLPSPGPPAGAARKLRLLLVDDHAIVRQSLARMLALEPDMEVVGEAADGALAVELSRRLQPDIVLMDINLPGMNGIEATRAIHAESPHIRLIGLSMLEDFEQAQAMQQAGASRYLTKSGPAEELLAAIRGTP